MSKIEDSPGVAGGFSLPDNADVCQLVSFYCSYISTTTGQMVIKCIMGVHESQRMIHDDFDDPLTFPLVPPSGPIPLPTHDQCHVSQSDGQIAVEFSLHTHAPQSVPLSILGTL